MKTRKTRPNKEVLHFLNRNGLTLKSFAQKHNFAISTVYVALRGRREKQLYCGLKTMEILNAIQQYKDAAGKKSGVKNGR